MSMPSAVHPSVLHLPCEQRSLDSGEGPKKSKNMTHSASRSLQGRVLQVDHRIVCVSRSTAAGLGLNPPGLVDASARAGTRREYHMHGTGL